MTAESGARAPSSPSRSTLRGPTPLAAPPKLGSIIGAVALAVIAVVIIISFVSAQRDNARIERLKNDGISLVAIAHDCVGNLGGSGSNASSYTCRAAYRVGATPYLEIVGHMNTFVSPGTHLHVVADPRQLSTIVLTSSLKSVSVTARIYVVPSVLSAIFVALVTWYFYRRHQSHARSRDDAQ